MSVTGWQLLALRAAKNLGCDVPPDAIEKAVAYVKRSQASSGAFCYTPHGAQTVPCTGTGILALEVCSASPVLTPEAVRGGNFLVRYPPHWGGGHFFYSIYYCTQATFQLGGKPVRKGERPARNYWEFFRPKMQKVLLDNQAPGGNWPDGDRQGENYATAMAVLALAVEYRFLPIYQRGEEPMPKK
jgi:hypothetical protein